MGDICWPGQRFSESQQCEHIMLGWELGQPSCWLEETQVSQALLPHAPECPRDFVLRSSYGRASTLSSAERQISHSWCSQEGLAIDYKVSRNKSMTYIDTKIYTQLKHWYIQILLWSSVSPCSNSELQSPRICLLTAFCYLSFWADLDEPLISYL